MEVLKGLRNLDLTEGKYHDSKALIACNSSKVLHLVKSFHVTSVTKILPPLGCFTGKVAILMSASPGELGGLRRLVHVCSILGNIGVLVLPEQKAIRNACQAFDENGNLTARSQQEAIEQLGHKLATITAKLTG